MAKTVKARVPAADERQGGVTQASAVVAVLTVTLAAIAAGGVFGLQLQALVEASLRREAEVKEAAPADLKPADLKPAVTEPATIHTLPPIVTNLAPPPNAWVRIEASIILGGDPVSTDEVLTTKIAEDIVAFLRTVPLADIEGASGFQHLREDLNDRMRVRSDGRVRELVVHTFLIE